MLCIIASFLFVAVASNICFGQGWDPSKFNYNPGPNYELVWQDEFENVGPAKAVIDGKPAYTPNPKNWVLKTGAPFGGIQNFTDRIENAYVQDNQLTIVAMKEGYTSAMLSSVYLQEFTFGKFAAKIRLPYSQGMWPAYWLVGNAWDKYKLFWPTVGEIDIIETIGGHQWGTPNDRRAHCGIVWNNKSNTMSPIGKGEREDFWLTPDGSMLHNNSLVYWVEWTPTNISIGLNEFTYLQFNSTNIPDSINPVDAWAGKWPFYMMLNIAIGGGWAGAPDNTTVWPQKMVVDWVRVDQVKKSKIE